MNEIRITEELKKRLRDLAEKYEILSFRDEDPSQFLGWYETNPENYADIEAASFIAAMLSFGNRKQFIPKIRFVLEMADGRGGQTSNGEAMGDRPQTTISSWLTSGLYKAEFPTGEKKFYRFYSYDDMQVFFGEIAAVLSKWGSLGEGIRSCVEVGGDRPLSEKLSDTFAALFTNSNIVPKGKNSANKRIHMFMRWMVRQNSPVDLGIWEWYPVSELVMPLDVHVMEEGIKLGLLPENAKATRKTAIQLTEKLKEVFGDDPVKGDFALFGVGVDAQ